VLVLDKPAGPSSHEVVAWVRRSLGERRVGHCGTLDPAATGVLVVCVGEATKLVAWLTDDDKRYAATIRLGRSTTTADAEGETLATAPIDAATLARAPRELAALRGRRELSPPRVSAVRIDGERAYTRARRGEDFVVPPRMMAVREVVLDDATLDPAPATTATVRATFEVGKGTYIRALAEALGDAVGVPAHLAALRRLRTGKFDLAAAAAAGTLVATRGEPRPDGKPRHRLLPADGADADTLRARLIAALITPRDAAPETWLRAELGDPESFARLCNGVTLDAAVLGALPPQAATISPDRGGAEAEDRPHPGRFVLVGGPPGSTAQVLATLDSGSPGAPAVRLRPVRVLGAAGCPDP